MQELPTSANAESLLFGREAILLKFRELELSAVR